MREKTYIFRFFKSDDLFAGEVNARPHTSKAFLEFQGCLYPILPFSRFWFWLFPKFFETFGPPRNAKKWSRQLCAGPFETPRRSSKIAEKMGFFRHPFNHLTQLSLLSFAVKVCCSFQAKTSRSPLEMLKTYLAIPWIP